MWSHSELLAATKIEATTTPMTNPNTIAAAINRRLHRVLVIGSRPYSAVRATNPRVDPWRLTADLSGSAEPLACRSAALREKGRVEASFVVARWVPGRVYQVCA